MKLHASDTQKYQTVTGYDDTGVEINAQRYNYSLIVLPEAAPRAWDAPASKADQEHFADRSRQPGRGHPRHRRAPALHPPKLTAALTMRRIGVECMDSQAACRTYNILMGEGRKVTLALIIDRNEGTA
jgi:uncharacterized protein